MSYEENELKNSAPEGVSDPPERVYIKPLKGKMADSYTWRSERCDDNEIEYARVRPAAQGDERSVNDYFNHARPKRDAVAQIVDRAAVIRECAAIARKAAMWAVRQEKADVRPGDPRYQHKATTALEIERQILALSTTPPAAEEGQE